MWQVPLAMSVGSMIMQNEQNKQIENQNRAQAEMAAAQTEHSPYTGMGAGRYNPQSTGSAVGAGMQGAMAGMSFQNAYNNQQLANKMAQNEMANKTVNAYANQIGRQGSNYALDTSAGYGGVAS